MKNRFLNAIYSLLPFLLFFFAARLTHAQSILLTHNPSIKYEMLSDSQQHNFDYLELEGKESGFVEFAPEAIEDKNGLVKVALGDAYLDAVVFKMKHIDYKTFDDYSWTGVYFDTANRHFARLFVVVQGNKIYGNISTHKGHYYIRDIGGGMAVFSFDDMTENPDDDGPLPTDAIVPERPIPPVYDLPQAQCGRDSTKILVVYTQAAVSAFNIDVNQQAAACMAYLNTVFANSKVDIKAHLAGVLVKDWTDNPVYYPTSTEQTREAVRLKLEHYNNLIQAERIAAKADLVIFMPRYLGSPNGSASGIASGIGTSYNFSYAALVPNQQVEYVFSHEIGHLYGARHEHDIDPVPGYNHAYKFYIDYANFYRTVMAYPPGQVIDQFSSADPTLMHMGHPTGTMMYHDNARKVREWRHANAAYFTDLSPFVPHLHMSNGSGSCLQTGTAVASIPEGCPEAGPFSYQWYESDNGIHWTAIAGSNSASIATFVPLPQGSNMANLFGSYNSRMYKVRLTGAVGEHYWAQGIAQYHCTGTPTGPSLPDNAAPATPTHAYLQLLPNPVEHQFALDFFVPGQEHIRISLIDAAGREHKLLYSGPGGSRHLTFDRDFAAGNYTLLLQGKHTRLSQKLVAR